MLMLRINNNHQSHLYSTKHERNSRSHSTMLQITIYLSELFTWKSILTTSIDRAGNRSPWWRRRTSSASRSHHWYHPVIVWPIYRAVFCRRWHLRRIIHWCRTRTWRSRASFRRSPIRSIRCSTNWTTTSTAASWPPIWPYRPFTPAVPFIRAIKCPGRRAYRQPVCNPTVVVRVRRRSPKDRFRRPRWTIRPFRARQGPMTTPSSRNGKNPDTESSKWTSPLI